MAKGARANSNPFALSEVEGRVPPCASTSLSTNGLAWGRVNAGNF